VTANQKNKSTYRFTPEVDKWVTEKAKLLGISKNAFVQMTLAKALGKDKKVS